VGLAGADISIFTINTSYFLRLEMDFSSLGALFALKSIKNIVFIVFITYLLGREVVLGENMLILAEMLRS
jgi:hypothetical protein